MQYFNNSITMPEFLQGPDRGVLNDHQQQCFLLSQPPAPLSPPHSLKRFKAFDHQTRSQNNSVTAYSSCVFTTSSYLSSSAFPSDPTVTDLEPGRGSLSQPQGYTHTFTQNARRNQPLSDSTIASSFDLFPTSTCFSSSAPQSGSRFEAPSRRGKYRSQTQSSLSQTQSHTFTPKAIKISKLPRSHDSFQSNSILQKQRLSPVSTYQPSRFNDFYYTDPSSIQALWNSVRIFTDHKNPNTR